MQYESRKELQLVLSPKVRGEVKGPLHTQRLQLLHHAQKPGGRGRGYFKSGRSYCSVRYQHMTHDVGGAMGGATDLKTGSAESMLSKTTTTT